MSEGEFHAYVGLLAVSAVILSVLAARGFGQSAGARVLDGVFAAGFLGYAGYLVIADPDTVRIFFYAFAAPVIGVVHAVKAARAARDRRIPMSYTAEPAPVPPQPFPAPPAPRAAGPAADGSAVDDVPSPYTYRAMPSGLPEQPPTSGPATTPPPVAGPRPSGLAGAPVLAPGESSRRYTPRPSGLPSPTPPPAAARDDVPFRLGPDDVSAPESAAEARRGHAEPAATAPYAYRPAHSWHEPRHASPEPLGEERPTLGRHRMPEPPADWPPHRA